MKTKYLIPTTIGLFLIVLALFLPDLLGNMDRATIDIYFYTTLIIGSLLALAGIINGLADDLFRPHKPKK